MQTNFLVIGSGIAGLNFALHAATKGHVTIITKKRIAETATNKAQGGIAAVIDEKDKFAEHIKDTMKAGAFHNNKKAVKFMVEKGPEAITRLIELGVEFEKEQNTIGKNASGKPGKLLLTREGGHSSRRIAYKGDYTGQEIESILVKRVKEHPNIDILENTFAVDLIRKGNTVYGAKIIRNNKIDVVFADAVILATGGIGQVYKYTTNPSISTGDGIAIAIRAGARVKDMEFIQFHPTAFATPDNDTQKKLNKKTRSNNTKLNSEPKFLLSEALRGEGAILLNSKGERFMHKYSDLKELAPRDLVARANYAELKNGPVYLSFKHLPLNDRKKLPKRFPTITKNLKAHHLDITKDLIPIVPVAHYLCGGIKTDLNGRTNLKNLYAFGETAYTGVHGANRLASNSLLEAFVFSNQVLKDLKPHKKLTLINLPHEKITNDKNLVRKTAKIKEEIKKTMWEKCGIIRTKKDLKEGLEKLKTLQKELKQICNFPENNALVTHLNRDSIETANILETAISITKSALKRKKSLGCHFITRN